MKTPSPETIYLLSILQNKTLPTVQGHIDGSWGVKSQDYYEGMKDAMYDVIECVLKELDMTTKYVVVHNYRQYEAI